MADGIHDLSDILVRVNGVEKLLLFLRGYPEISLTNGGNKSAIYDGTSRLFTLYIIDWFHHILLIYFPH